MIRNGRDGGQAEGSWMFQAMLESMGVPMNLATGTGCGERPCSLQQPCWVHAPGAAGFETLPAGSWPGGRAGSRSYHEAAEPTRRVKAGSSRQAAGLFVPRPILQRNESCDDVRLRPGTPDSSGRICLEEAHGQPEPKGGCSAFKRTNAPRAETRALSVQPRKKLRKPALAQRQNASAPPVEPPQR
jgi:hypothetical protein